jgi:heat shock protein HslJ
MMACPPDVMAQADAFSAALNRASTRRLADGRLQLLGDDGTVLASFVPQPATLAGTAWRVSAYNNGRQAVTSVRAGTSLTLAFGSDGRVSGSAGCNNYTGPYALTGERLTIGPVAATRRMCVEPPGVMDQEQQFLEALSTIATARFEGGRVELRTATGALAATLVKE